MGLLITRFSIKSELIESLVDSYADDWLVRYILMHIIYSRLFYATFLNIYIYREREREREREMRDLVNMTRWKNISGKVNKLKHRQRIKKMMFLLYFKNNSSGCVFLFLKFNIGGNR